MIPLLEKAEYARETATGHLGAAARAAGRRVLTRSGAARDERWLSHDETPAPDPKVLPYHLSSLSSCGRAAPHGQIEPGRRVGRHGGRGARRGAAQLIAPYRARRSTLRHRRRGPAHLYHDATTVPAGVAPAWAFVAATNRSAGDGRICLLSSHVGGCYARRLGSDHTPAPALGRRSRLSSRRRSATTGGRGAAGAARGGARGWPLPELRPLTDPVVSRHGSPGRTRCCLRDAGCPGASRPLAETNACSPLCASMHNLPQQ